ncbi:MAG: hypothetical protein AB9861_00910 [Methanosarcina sp.]
MRSVSGKIRPGNGSKIQKFSDEGETNESPWDRPGGFVDKREKKQRRKTYKAHIPEDQ